MSYLSLIPTLQSRSLPRLLARSRPLWTTLDELGTVLDDFDYGFTHDRFALDETDTAFVFTMPLPGFKKGDVEIEVSDGAQLTVTAARGGGKVESTKTVTGHSVSRSIILPSDADLDKIEAKLEDGLLHITVAKAVQPAPRKVTVA